MGDVAAWTLADFFNRCPDDDLGELLRCMVQVSDPDLLCLAEMLQDEDACGQLLAAFRELTAMDAERWGSAAAVHSCTKPGGCLAGLARSSPKLLDGLRERLVAARDHVATAKRREEALPTRRLPPSAVSGGRAGSAILQTAVRDMAALRESYTAESPADAASAAWRELGDRGVCVRGCKAFCSDFVGKSNRFGYRLLVGEEGRSRAAGVSERRAGSCLLSAGEVIDTVCCPADCSPTAMGLGTRRARASSMRYRAAATPCRGPVA